MKFPRAIGIKGKVWKIRRQKVLKHLGEPCRGICDFETRTMYLRNDATIDILFHEVTHAILHELHIEMDGTLNETIVDGLTTVIFELFKVNLIND